MLEQSEIKSFREKYHNTGVYTTAYRYSSPNQAESNLFGSLYLDFDSDSDEVGYEQVKQDAIRAIAYFSAIFSIQPEELFIFFSGKKGIHIMVPYQILAIEPHKDLNQVFKLIAQDVHKISEHKTVDLRIYDRVRLLRLPNSIHPDTKLYKVPMTYEQFKSFNYEEVTDWAMKKQPIEKKQPRYNTKASRAYKEYIEQWEKEKVQKYSDKRGKQTLNFCPPCVRHMLRNDALEGKRNNTVAAMSSYFKQRGYSEEEAMKRLIKWNNEYCSPPLTERELKTTMKSIYGGQYIYGCTSLAEISGACDTSKCKLAKK